jgi:hypothetical protein
MAQDVPFSFSFLTLDEVGVGFRHDHLDLEAIAQSNAPRGESLDDIRNVAEAALAMFRGIYPTNAPYFWWGNGLELPWHAGYWVSDGTGEEEMMKPVDVTAEVAVIAAKLAASAEYQRSRVPLNFEAFSSPQHEVQTKAVQVLMVLDTCVGDLASEKYFDAINWLAFAYHLHIDAVLACERVLDRATSNARMAASVRHAENRAMKRQVMEWYTQHHSHYPSMDAAAEAVAGKLVPVTFRTARAWIGESKKQLRSASTP